MRTSLRVLFLASALALPAAGWTAEPNRFAEAGVWTGTVGTQPVLACFQEGERQSPPSGVYFYRKYGKVIQLQREAERSGWTERGDKGVTGRWALSMAGGILAGTWQDASGKRPVPIRLERFHLLHPAIPDLGCWHALFTPESPPQSRQWPDSPDILSTETLSNGRQYRVLGFADGAVRSIALLGDGRGVASLNARLANELVERRAAYYGCPTLGSVAAGAAPPGTKPEFISVLQALHWTDRWVSLQESSSGDCGGAHPFADTTHTTWDLHADRPANLWKWILGARKKDADARFDDYYLNYQPPKSLLKLIAGKAVHARLRQFPEERKTGQAGCIDVLREATDYQVTLGARGIVFAHAFPRALQACSENVEVPYSEIRPFLTESGRMEVDQLERGTLPR